MPTTIKERSLTFVFGDTWHVVKYDDDPVYLEGLQRLKGTIDGKQHDTVAIDILALRGDLFAIVEVKDFRGHASKTRGRLISGELAKEVAFKVRDSLAGIVGAHRWASNTAKWGPFAKGLISRGKQLKVLLWLEQDVPRNSFRVQQKLSIFTQKLKRECRWLTTKVLVVNRTTYSTVMPDLAVSERQGTN